MTREEASKLLQVTKLMLMDGANQPISDLYYALDMAIEALEQTEPQMIRCPKCGRSDYIREFGKDFSVTAEESGFKYKCINCNTYIEPQSDRKTESNSEKPNNSTISKMEQVDEPQTCDTCKYGEDKHKYAHICNECGVGINNYEPRTERSEQC